MIASLPMYDFPEVRSATDALWQTLAHHLKREGVRNVPEQLVHDRHLHDLWSDPSLFISQCCGFDIINRYEDRLQVLATPWFDAPDCSCGHYASTVVVSENAPYQDVTDMLGSVVVINGPESQSGMNALFSLVSPYRRDGRFFSEVISSGSHAESLAAVKRGDADVAAIDCHTYGLLRRYRPSAVEGTRRLGLTHEAPAPPYVTSASVDMETVGRMQNALLATFEDPGLADTLKVLMLQRVEKSTADTYRSIHTNFSHDLRAV